MTIIANIFSLYEDYNNIFYLFWIVCFSQEKRKLWNTKALISFWNKTCMLLPLHSPRHTHILASLQTQSMCILKMYGDPVRYLIQQSGGKGLLQVQSVPAWQARHSHRGFLPWNNTKCLDTYVQIVNDLPSVSKLIHDLKQNHVFYSFSRPAILFSQIISNFPFADNYTFFLQLFKSE